MAVDVVNVSHKALSQVDHYRQVIMQFLLEQTGGEGSWDEVESQPIFDVQRDRFLILSQGWRGQERVYWVVMHLELRDGKVWIQRNQTEVEIEAELMALGIPQEEIVLGMIPPEYRSLAGFTEA